MYSCNPTHPNQTNNSDSSKNRLCRFSGRLDETHQGLGCKDCPRAWDKEYLSKMGLIKLDTVA